MNVMKKAHQLTRAYFTYFKGVSDKYAAVFKRSLVAAHKEFKAMTNTVKLEAIKAACEADTRATGFAITGTAIDCDGELVRVGYSTGHEGAIQAEAAYYYAPQNGFTSVDLYLTMYYTTGEKEFKIVK